MCYHSPVTNFDSSLIFSFVYMRFLATWDLNKELRVHNDIGIIIFFFSLESLYVTVHIWIETKL